MERTQIYLTASERKALRALGRRLGRSQSALIREAVDRYIDRYQEGNRLDLLRSGRAIWAKRRDLPEFEQVRRELDRIGIEKK
ncbi:MAG TPA: CopG family transcriptional regulator [Myxococcota bacterium]